MWPGSFPTLAAMPATRWLRLLGHLLRARKGLIAVALLPAPIPACSVPRSTPGPCQVNVEKGIRITATGDSVMYLFFQDAIRARSVERPAISFQAMLAELGTARVSVGRTDPDTSIR